MKIYDLQWSVGYTDSLDTAPNERFAAVVPGAVQLDWARAHNWEDYFYADNWKDYLWMEDVYWSYKTSFTVPEFGNKDKVFFVCKGVDYQFIVKLNGEVVHQQEGMFTPFEINMTDKISVSDPNELEIIIFSAPKRKGAPVGRKQADQCCKPAVSYGWDWHPRLIPLGIWDEAYIEVLQTPYISNAEVIYSLDEELTTAYIDLEAAVSETNGMQLRWQMIDKNDDMVLNKVADLSSGQVRISDELKKPELWWPNEYGEPTLYTSRVELLNSEGDILYVKEAKVGFRRIRLVMHPGAWDYPSEFPKSRSNPPITLEINGSKMFCKGSNWVNPEIFPGIINADTYLPLLQLAKDAHMNLLRVWGGGIINKECFYEQCDEMGIMVWQEFPLACNNYVGTPEYLRVLDRKLYF